MRHYLELTDGICIEAFPKTEPPEKIEKDNLALDTTGEFLQMGGGRKRRKKIATCTDEEQLKLFLQNAHRLIGEGDKIMADSRMFLAPVPIRMGWHIRELRVCEIRHSESISSGGATISAPGRRIKTGHCNQSTILQAVR